MSITMMWLHTCTHVVNKYLADSAWDWLACKGSIVLHHIIVVSSICIQALVIVDGLLEKYYLFSVYSMCQQIGFPMYPSKLQQY